MKILYDLNEIDGRIGNLVLEKGYTITQLEE
jgi:hypothetical protein